VEKISNLNRQTKEKMASAEVKNSMYDDYVLALDPTLDENPEITWGELKRVTLFLLSRRMKAFYMDTPGYTPEADYELAKRQHDEDEDVAAPENPIIMKHIAPLLEGNPKRSRWRDSAEDRTVDAPAPNGKYQQGLGQGTYTWGVKLNALVAGTWVVWRSAGAASGDPHPEHPCQLPPPETIEDKTSSWPRFVEFVERAVASVLNDQAQVLTSVSDPKEDTVWSQVHERFVHIMCSGSTYEQAVSQLEADFQEAFASEEVGDSAPFHELELGAGYGHYNFSGAGLNFKDLTEQVYNTIVGTMTSFTGEHNAVVQQSLTQAGFAGPKDICNFLPDDIRMAAECVGPLLASHHQTKNLPEADVAEIRKRIAYYIETGVVQVWRRMQNCQLPFLKKRYLTFSVSHDRHPDRSGVKAAQYANCPPRGATNPLHRYRWVPIEVASPVFDAGPSDNQYQPQDNLNGPLARVCRTLRYSMRTHHSALPTLNMTTSVYIGHTEGFTLLELKKFITMWLYVEAELAYLHRGYRVSKAGRWTCNSIVRGSRLAAVVGGHSLTRPLNDPDGILPHQPPETAKFWDGVMQQYLPTEDMFTPFFNWEELFVRCVWQYTSISDLARALETTGPPERTSVAIRCGGRQRSSHVRTRAERDARLVHNGENPPFLGEIDRHRGVIEFRQMGQSLDPGAIISWAAVAENVVRTARETTLTAFRELILLLINDEKTPVSTILDCNAFSMRFFSAKDDDGRFFEPVYEGKVDYAFPFYKAP
jgi:hypothetical protein